MLNYLNRPISSSSSAGSGRVQSWLDSMYSHHVSFDDDEKVTSKSSLASIQSSKCSTNKISTKNSVKSSSRKSLSTSSSSSFTNRHIRGIRLRRPRYLVRRFPVNKKSNDASYKSDLDQQASYLSSNYSSDDESNLFSTNISGLGFLANDDSTINDTSQKLPEIKADDLEFESRHSFTSLSSDSSNCTNNYSTNNHSFGILDLENWVGDQGLQLNDNLTFKVKTYAFSPKDIKIKIQNNTLIVIGKQQIEEENGWFKREFKKKFELPAGTAKSNIQYDFDKNDHLIITVPRSIHSVH